MNPQALRLLALNYRATDGIRNSRICKAAQTQPTSRRLQTSGIILETEMNTEYLDPQQCADMLAVKKRTFLERYAPRPDFPARIAISKKRFWWKKEEVVTWLNRQKEKRPMM